MKKSRKRLTAAMAILCCLSLLVGSFAFFTDRLTANTGATAGNMDLVFTDISSSKTGANEIVSPNTYAIDESWENKSLISDGGVINPGDFFDLSYTVSNEGNKSMDVRQQLILTSDVPLNDAKEEYVLSINNTNWLYNGVELPQLPYWNNSEFPYIAIAEQDGSTLSPEYAGIPLYKVTYSTAAAHYYFNSGGMGFDWFDKDENYKIKQLIFSPYPDFELLAESAGFPMVGKWALVREAESSPNFAPFAEGPFIWSNHDVLGVDLDENSHHVLGDIYMEGTTPIMATEIEGTLSADKMSITYDLPDIVLNGIGTGAEVEDGVEVSEETYTVRLNFDKDAGNAFMGSNVAVSYKAQAKQHRNTNDSHWATWAEYETKYGEIDTNGGAAGGEEPDPNAVAFAVYSEDDTSLRFYKRAEVPVAGQEYNGLTATAVYPDIETTAYYVEDMSTPGWINDNTWESISNVVIEDEIQPISTAFWFALSNCTSMDLAKLNTSNVTNMNYMFYDSMSLSSIDVSGFDTSKVSNMESMFYGCSGLTTLDLSNFDTSNVSNMQYMFYGCSGLTALDLSNFDTSNVSNMEYMFFGCSGLTTLDLSNVDTSDVSNMQYMFFDCSGLTTLDLSSFDTSNVTNMYSMFHGCSKLKTIYASDLWSTVAVTKSGSMFYPCTNLVGVIAYDSSVPGDDQDVTYANTIDGYLTYKAAA